MSDPSNNPPDYTTTDVSNVSISGDAVSPQAHNRVTVNLHINVNVQGNVDIFTASGEQMKNVVVCAQKLPVAALYQSASVSALQFYEPTGVPGEISGNVNAAFAEGTGTIFGEFETGMQTVVAATLDASGAAPFSTYTGISKVQKFASFGDLVLSLYAHYIFGHAAATAAIDNDTNLVAYMNSSAAEGGANGGADIGLLLARALAALSPEVATTIVRQIQAQDPSRTRGLGNNQDQAQAVVFAANDTIFVQITVEEPSLSVGNQTTGGQNTSGAPGAGTAANTNLVGSAYPAENPFVTLQVTLGAPVLLPAFTL